MKIKSTSRHDISRNEGELSDIEAGMKPLKIIEKEKNEKNGKDILSLGDSGSTAVSFPSSGKPITKKIGHASGCSIAINFHHRKI